LIEKFEIIDNRGRNASRYIYYFFIVQRDLSLSIIVLYLPSKINCVQKIINFSSIFSAKCKIAENGEKQR
jgi:hypothetical protein